MLHRKGQISGKMQEICINFPCKLAALCVENDWSGVSHMSKRDKVLDSFLTGRATVCDSKSQLKPM